MIYQSKVMIFRAKLLFLVLQSIESLASLFWNRCVFCTKYLLNSGNFGTLMALVCQIVYTKNLTILNVEDRKVCGFW